MIRSAPKIEKLYQVEAVFLNTSLAKLVVFFYCSLFNRSLK